MNRSPRVCRTVALLFTSAATALVAGCGLSTADGSASTGSPTAAATLTQITPSPGTGSLGPGFATDSALPPPGGTMTPSPASWSGVTVPEGYTAVLVSTDDNASARVLTAAVKTWAAAHDVTLSLVPAHDPATYVASIQKAIDLKKNLVISAGDPLADPMALVTASWLDQKFLVLGAELAEPTANVTAAIWAGVNNRGGGATHAASDPSTFTADRAGRAMDAGVAAVLRGYSGFVVKVD
ncbi:hypothetical protein [Nocardioides sp.]|uniref:hypothetical protein n=1 Tax=Nocardioides sp. TaxID=35761 RepID=UPI00260472AD|nr:hypothetical protein [Nocardioides sp.]